MRSSLNVDAQVARYSPHGAGNATGTPPERRNRLRSLFSIGTNHGSTVSFTPHALRPSVLLLVTLTCWALIVTLQLLLKKSQNDGGVIFAPRINDLPLSKTFMFQYFPTILAVIFSIFWNWIDLEAKRLEPYYQLSKEDGALGKDSLLLAYPFDFLPLVPISAARCRHWSVFWASSVVMIITWALVPTQAGIFATTTVTRSYSSIFDISTAFLPSSQQDFGLTLRFAQSVYGIVVLNETLPAYMSRDYALAPFKTTSSPIEENDVWYSQTTLYSVDVTCEEAKQGNATNGRTYLSSTGCKWPNGIDSNMTIGDINPLNNQSQGFLGNKEFTAIYTGYWNDLGFADYFLSDNCPPAANHTFYAGFTRNKEKKSDQPNKPASIFCTSTYYEQTVNATLDATSMSPLSVTPVGEKQSLSTDIFNTTLFESQISSETTSNEVRGALPTKSFPTYGGALASTNLSLTEESFGTQLHAMAALAVLSSNQTLDTYLNATALAGSSQSAYRLLFSRAMVEILDRNFSSSAQMKGQTQSTSQAVILVPVFTYIVEGLLGLVSLGSLVLLYISMTRKLNLRADPSTIASVMSLTADEQSLLADFEGLNSRPTEEIHAAIAERKYKLGDVASGNVIYEVQGIGDMSMQLAPPDYQSIAKPVRPVEFRSFVALPFFFLHIALAALLAVLLVKSRPNGLPLPSQNKIVQNLLENYIPTALATLIEPMWILINRLLCLLQPFNELRKGNTKPNRSIDLDYASLPPQLVIFKALRSRHFILAAVCSMGLLANVLAVAFAGIFNQDTANVSTTTNFVSLYEAKFVAINGSVGPKELYTPTGVSGQMSGAYTGGEGDDQFLVADSNYTRGTQLPSWTDANMFYLPFAIPQSSTSSNKTFYEGRTKAFGMTLDCTPLKAGTNYVANLTGFSDRHQMHLETVVKSSSGDLVPCSANSVIRKGIIAGFGDGYLCQEGLIATEVTLPLGGKANYTAEQNNTCAGSISLGWVRASNGTCHSLTSRTLADNDSFFVQCQPRIEIGDATVMVDADGRLQRPAQNVSLLQNLTEQELAQYFSNNPIEMIKQWHNYLLDTDTLWHNDTFASQYINYFARAKYGTRLLDPTKPVPTIEDAQNPLSDTYAYLFAIWLGVNKDKLFVGASEGNTNTISGSKIESVERLFLSTPLSAIALGILGCYAVVSILVYLRRPGQYLARLPTSVASIIALFAASTAVHDMRGTSQFTKKERRRHLDEVGARYGYGSYVGAGGRVHIGIEKTPFVRMRSVTGLEKALKAYWGWRE